MDSIYSFIKSYIPNSNRNPKEDYLTQILAWTLKNIPGFRQDFIGFLINRLKTQENELAFTDLPMELINIETQYSIDKGFIDMLIEGENNGFIFEHKIYSSLSYNQIEKYKQAIEKEYTGTFYTVLITATTIQHTQPADIKLIWADVYDFVLEIMDNYDNTDRFLLEQLTSYLKQQGLGRLSPVSLENIMGYFPGIELERKLDVLFERVMEVNWTEKCPNLKFIQNNTYDPIYIKKQWGRKGINFFSAWRPGIFAGILLNGNDHGLDPLDNTQPDFVILLEYGYDKNNRDLMDMRDTFINSENFVKLDTLLKQDHGTFTKYDSKLVKSPWRLIVLRKPISDIFKDASTLEKQVDALRDAICEGLDLLTQDIEGIS